MLKVKLLRPLDGKAEGETAEYPVPDAKRLEKAGVIKIIRNPAPAAKQAKAPANKSAAPPANKATARAATKAG